MTKAKSLLKVLVTNTIFGTCLYLGTVQGISGFMNVVAFLIWFAFVIFALTFMNEESQIKTYEANNKRLNLGVIGHLITAGYIGVLVFYGHVLLGVIYLLTVILGNSMIEKGKQLVEGSNS